MTEFTYIFYSLCISPAESIIFIVCHDRIIGISAGYNGGYLRINAQKLSDSLLPAHPTRDGQIHDDRIKRLFDDALAKGATVAAGGTLEEADRTIHPTLLTNVTPDMLIMQEEIFAPIVPVMTYKTIDDAVDYISGRDKPLALYIFSDDEAVVDKVLSQTSSGGVTINGFFMHYLENNLPFGGVNQSGMGSYHGEFGFRAFSHERAVYVRH